MRLVSLVYGYKFRDFYSGSSPGQAIRMKRVFSGEILIIPYGIGLHAF